MTGRGAPPGSLLEHEDLRYDLTGPHRVEPVSTRLPPLPPRWVRVSFAYCGLCGSDVSRYLGVRAATYPVSLGHEWVAVVDAVGAEVVEVSPGDVVTSDLNFRCGKCRHCVAGRSHLCVQGQVSRFTNRGFATRGDIHVGYLQRCAGPPLPHLALAEPLACVLHALSHCNVSADDRVLVMGAGSLGLCASFALAHGWPGAVGAFDVTDVALPRLAALAGALADRGMVVPRPVEEYDAVLDVSGSAAGLRAACQRVRPGGRLCTVSHLADDADAGFLLRDLMHKDVRLGISYLDGPKSNLTAAVDLLHRAWSSSWDRLLEVRELADLPEVFAERVASTANKVVIAVGSSTSSER
jgi:threonine dehydrogenase-like Zn-dependent dehydrogenase